MTLPPDKMPEAAARALSRALAEAPDDKLLSVVSFIDALPNPATADTLIAPLRPRLARLRPRRRLRFTRLLFLPLDPLIVPAPRWRPADATIPRSVLNALAATVRAALESAALQIETLLAKRSASERERVQAAGALLWPLAGRILLSPTPTPAWDETGLSADRLAPLARRIGAVLLHFSAIDALAIDAERNAAAPEADSAANVLTAVARTNPDATGMAVALLLARAPHIRSALEAAGAQRGDGAVRQHCDRAIETLLHDLESDGGTETRIAAASLPEAASHVRRIAALLAEAKTTEPSGRARVQALSQRLDASCQLKFGEALETAFLRPLRRMPDVETTALGALEGVVRALRELELEARVVGGGGVYDSLLRNAADAVRAPECSAAMDLVDRARLVELLAGPEAALAMFLPRR